MVAIALVLCMLTAWLILGSTARSIAVDGVLVEPVVEGVEGTRSVQALVWVDGDVASQVQAGMPVAIEWSTTGGATDRLDGEIAAVSAVPLTEGLATLEAVVPVAVRRVRIVLDEDPGLVRPAGRECRIVIELGRQSLAALLGMRRP